MIEDLVLAKRQSYRTAGAFYRDFEGGKWLRDLTLPAKVKSSAVRKVLKTKWLDEADFTRSYDHRNIVLMRLELVVDELTVADLDRLRERNDAGELPVSLPADASRTVSTSLRSASPKCRGARTGTSGAVSSTSLTPAALPKSLHVRWRHMCRYVKVLPDPLAPTATTTGAEVLWDWARACRASVGRKSGRKSWASPAVSACVRRLACLASRARGSFWALATWASSGWGEKVC